MLRPHRALLNQRTTAGPLVAHQPHLSRAAGSFVHPSRTVEPRHHPGCDRV